MAGLPLRETSNYTFTVLIADTKDSKSFFHISQKVVLVRLLLKHRYSEFKFDI